MRRRTPSGFAGWRHTVKSGLAHPQGILSCGHQALSTRIFLSSVLILAGTILCGCGANQRAWTTQDAWYNAAPPETPARREWEAVDRARIHEVLESNASQAEELLRDVSSVALSGEQAAELIGEALPEVPGGEAYLTRAVYLNRGTGNYSAYVLEDQLLVHHSSLGHRAVPMKRQALVLQLAGRPAEVYATCSMAE